MGYDIEALPSFLRFLAHQLESVPRMQQRIEQLEAQNEMLAKTMHTSINHADMNMTRYVNELIKNHTKEEKK